MPFGSSLPQKIVFFKVAPPFALTRSCYSARVTGTATAVRMMRMVCSSCATRSGTKAKGTASGATGSPRNTSTASTA